MSQDTSGRPVAILLVEDNPGDARLLEWYLSKPGTGDFQVKRAERLSDALRELAATRFDLVLLDLSLPDSAGLDTVRSARRAAGMTPIVVMTGLDDEETALAALRDGAQDYLVKGKFNNRELTRSLHYAIERERVEQALRQTKEALEAIIAASPAAVLSLDTAGRVVTWNESAEHIFGWTAAEAVGRRPPFVPAESEAQFDALLGRILAGEPISDLNLQRRRKDGTLIDVSLSASRIRGADDAASGVVEVLADITERKQAEAALHESKERFRELFDSMSSGVAVYETRDQGASFIFKDYNQGAERIDSLRREEVVGRDVRQVFPGIEEFGLLAVLQRVWQTGRPERHPVGRYEDGRIAGWRENYIYRLASGEVVTVYDDVTARMQAEATMRESEERFRGMFDAARDGMVLADVETGRFVTANGAFCDMVGYGPDEVVRLSMPDIHPSDSLARVKGSFDRLAAGKISLASDIPVKRRDGSVFHADVSAAAILVGDRSFLMGVFHNITERRATETRLRESELKFRAIFDSASEGMFLVEQESRRFTLANSSCLRMLGYSADEFSNLNITDLHPEEDLPFVFEQIRSYTKGETGRRGDIRYKRKDGSLFPADTSPAGVMLGDKACILIMFRDITERKQAEEALVFSNVILRTQQETSIDGILVVDEEGGVISFNQRFVDMWGIPLDVIESKSDERALESVMDKLASPEEFARKVQHLYEVHDEVSRDEIVLKDGATFDRYSAPMLGAGEKYYGRVWYFRDITERKQAETALRETSAYLDNLITHANAPIIVWDPDFKITRFNRAFERLTGRKESDVKDRTLDILFPAGRREDSLSLIHRTATGERWETVEIPIQHVDGNVFTVLWNSATIYTPDGSVLATIAQGQDITERKRAEGETKRSAELQAAIIEMLRVSLEDLSLDSILGKSLDIIAAIPWLVLDSRGSIHLVEDDPQVLVMKAQRGLARPLLATCDRVPFGRCLCGRAASTRQIVFADHLDDSHENRYDDIRDHGHYCVPMLSADQRVLGVLNLYFAAGGRRNDGTERLLGVVANVLAGVVQRKQAEAALAESELTYRRVFEGSNDAMVLFESGKFLDCNEAALRIFGYSTRDEFLGKGVGAISPPLQPDGRESRSAIGEHTVTAFRDGRDFFEWLQQRPDGTVFPADVLLTPLDYHGRKVLQATVRDISPRKIAEAEIAEKNAELAKLNELKNQLLGMAAHDLRNPLTVVNTASAFLLDDASRLLSAEKKHDFMRRINANGEFMLKLIDNLLDVAKIESGRLDLELATGDLCGLIEENLTMNRMLAEKKSIRLDFAPECGMPLFRFDRGKVEQVLNNLISNALKFSEPGTAVTVQASRANGTVVVSVRDHGQGIPAEDLDKLFKPFGRTTVRSTAGEKSTGLGLAICRKIVEGHHGRIWAESEVGKGSNFSFSLPVASDDKSQAPKPPTAETPNPKHQISNKSQ
jgi:PAS domain S-box-containing protein